MTQPPSHDPASSNPENPAGGNPHLPPETSGGTHVPPAHQSGQPSPPASSNPADHTAGLGGYPAQGQPGADPSQGHPGAYPQSGGYQQPGGYSQPGAQPGAYPQPGTHPGAYSQPASYPQHGSSAPGHVGTQGPQGPQHQQGPQGPQGQQYQQAPQGPQYQQGPQGPQGPQGAYPPQGYGQQPPGPPVQTKKRSPAIFIIAIVTVMALAGGIAYGYVRSRGESATPAAPSLTVPTPKPATSAPTGSTTKASTGSTKATTTSAGDDGTFSLDGSDIVGDGFKFGLPTGWTISDYNGTKNLGEIIDADKNVIIYYPDQPPTAKDECEYQLEAIRTATSDPVVDVAATWGNDSVIGQEITVTRPGKNPEVFGFYCLDHGNRTVMIESISWIPQAAAVKAATLQVLATWQWT